ncbi:MAG: MerR family transcriptional regulator [Chitinophagaceae bacterium]
MKKQLQQITLFDAPAEVPAPAEKVTLSNTAPTPPRIVEIVEEEENEPTQIDAAAESPEAPVEEITSDHADSEWTEQETEHAATAPVPPAIIELPEEEEEQDPPVEVQESSSSTNEEAPSLPAEEQHTGPEPVPAATAPVPPHIIEIITDEEEQPLEAITEPVVSLTSKISFFATEQPANTVEDNKTGSEEMNTPEEAPLPKRISSTRGRKSLKETAITADLIQVPEDDILFAKQYYSIGEVATMFRENQSLIRYWETEFDILQPRKNKKGDRFFRPVDIKNLVLIYDLLRRRKFTIEGAKDFLKRNKKVEDKFAMIQSLEKIKSFLLELRTNL